MNENLNSQFYKKSSNRDITEKINLLGIRLKPSVFITFRLISSIILFILLFLVFKYGYIIAPIISILYYLLFEYVLLDCNLKKRCYVLESDALEFFPIFLIALKSGRNIKKALEVSTDIVKNSLSKEFVKVLNDVVVGKSLDESLTLMVNRIPSDILTNIIISIIESERLGNNLSEGINLQLDYIRVEKRKKDLYKYKVVPLKLVFLMIVFILILIFVLIGYKYIF